MVRNTRRAAAASAPVDDNNSDGSPLSSAGAMESPPPAESQGSGLKFNKALTWRAGKPIPVAELLKRLQALSTEMRGMEQDDEGSSKDSFIPIAKALANEQLLGHKDKGVRAYSACCAVDVLRLCAPTAPFSQRELRAVFDMILKSILPSLSDPSHAYNQQHMYVLQSLAEVKSIVLATELPNAESYIEHLFVLFFDILSGSTKTSTGEQLSKQVFFNLTSILVVLVDEMESLPQEVVDTIIAQFLRVDARAVSSGSKSKKGAAIEERQSTFEMKELPPAYSMAKTICNSCDEKMAREVSKYFSDVIVEATTNSGKERRESGDVDGQEDSFVGPSEEDLKELEKAHRLLRELWRASPPVLQNVIPQLEAELQAENVRLRLLATETLGDIVSGIGAAGPPPPPSMDPAAYPKASFSAAPELSGQVNLLTIPSSPQSFPQTFAGPYASFLGRKNDKSPVIRAAWTTAIGRILMTGAGGVGLGHTEERTLVEDLARMLNDSDEKVRLAGVRAISQFSLNDVVSKLSGSVDKEFSVLANLSERVKDRKPAVREEAMMALARIWGVASGEIAMENEEVQERIGGAASKILNAFYTNDPEIQALIDKVLFEVLLPLTYPPIKNKSTKTANGSSQRVQDSQTAADTDESAKKKEPDDLRAQRILVLVKGLDERAKKVFFAICSRQVTMSKYLLAYLDSCEKYNGGVMDQDEETITARLKRLIDDMAKFFPNQSKVTSDLWAFAKAHDRRNYQLLKFCMKPENDFRFVYNSIKEFRKRTETANPPNPILGTFLPLIYRSSLIIYNRSHIPSYMAYAKTDELSLASTAHSVLNEVSQKRPEVLKANVKEICMSLQAEAPTASRANGPGTVESLKACAAFARKFTDEIPQDIKFTQAMTNFALYGTPPEAAKHAVSVIMASSKRKELLAKDLVSKCLEGFQYGKSGFLSRLAALSRLCLLAPSQIDDHADSVVDIAITGILLKNRTTADADTEPYKWTDDTDDECAAKLWAIRVLVNRIRSHPQPETLEANAKPVYELLERLVVNEGELSSKKDTPPSHKTKLRLAAGRSYLKLCLQKSHEQLLLPQTFQKLALVAQDTCYPVRAGFLQRLRKYLGRNGLPARFYTVPFLLAYEPDPALKNETVTWLKSRAAFFATYKAAAPTGTEQNAKVVPSKASTTLESVFPRLLSLLAHHPDYGTEVDELKELARYIVFYLATVASENNISLVFHVAQRVKACNDVLAQSSSSKSKSPKAIDQVDYSTRLHTLSDLATMTIRSFIEAHGWTLQSLPARLTLPRTLFAEIKDHATAQEIASNNFLPDGTSDEIDRLIRATLRRSGHPAANKKRKSTTTDGEGGAKKRTKMSVREKKDKTPKRRRRDWDADDDEEEDEEARAGQSAADRVRSQLDASRRHSARKSNVSTTKGLYRERDDSEDDEEMEVAQEEDEADNDEGSDGTEEDGDEEMPDADDDHDAEEGEAEEEEQTSPPPTISRTRQKATPKKPAAKTPSKAKITPKANGASAEKEKPSARSKSSKAKENAKPLPTPTRSSGRTTRSRG